MAVPKRIKGRYEIKDVLGRGGMGVVYRALDMDPSMRGREVALKTIVEAPDRTALDLFEKERLVLATLNHPNIVPIFDSGEFEEEGERKPFFVMPLLQGQSLDRLIRNASHRLTVDRVVKIFGDACRGLHAAHERGLVHRDLKPSNIFILNDDSVQIIDFGVAHMVDNRSSRGRKGTLLYMSPEQLAMKTVTASSDIFSLGVVCYEALTQRRPFDRPTQSGVFDAILHQIPPPASELNASVSTLMSRVIAKAMAKQSYHRFASAREFAETLEKALRNEPIEIFDPARIQPRLERVRKVFEQGDYEFAGEILTELEAEGHVDHEMVQLRRRINQAVLQKRTRQLLDTARTRFEEGEDPLALQKVEEVLELDPDNVEALTLKAKIESRRSELQIENWLSLARQHLQNRAYSYARQALQSVLQMRPQEGRASELLAEVDRDEQEYTKLRRDKEQLYQAAQDAWHEGDISTALDEMGQVIALERRAPDTTSPERGATYQSFYNQVRSDHDAITNAHSEARKHLAESNFEKALALCEEYLAKYPNHALFKALKFDAQEQRRRALSAFIADIDRRVAAEPDLDRRLGILREALAAHPNEPRFEHSLKLSQEQHDLVDAIVAKARLYEGREQFREALGQWQILQTIYEQYPGLAFEIERVTKRRDQQTRSQAKARWVEQIDGRLSAGDYGGCLDLLVKAQIEFPGDNELAEIEKLARQGVERRYQAQELLTQGQEACAKGAFDEGLVLLRRCHDMDTRNTAVRAALLENLTQYARRLVDTDWRTADRLAQEALELDSGHPVARNIRVLVEDLKQQGAIDECITDVRHLQAAGDLQRALAGVERGLASYPRETRLIQLRDTLQRELSRAEHGQSRRRDLEELRRLNQAAEQAADPVARGTICETALELAGRHPGDEEFDSLASIFRSRFEPVGPQIPNPKEAPRAAPETPLHPSSPPIPVDGSPATSAAPAAQPAKPVPSPVNLGAWLKTAAKYARDRRVQASLAALLIVGVVIGVIFRHYPVKPASEQPLPPLANITFETNPPGAALRIDGQDKGLSPLTMELEKRSYLVEAVKEGYRSFSQKIDVPGVDNKFTLPLKPLPLKLQLFVAGLKHPQIQWDGSAAGDVADGKWGLDVDLDSQSHTLEISAGSSSATLSFGPATGALPIMVTPPEGTNVGVVTITTFGSQGHVSFFPVTPETVTLDGQSYNVTAGGVELNAMSNEQHTLTWDENKGPRSENFESGPPPMLTVFLTAAGTSEKPAVGVRKVKTPPVTPTVPAPVDAREEQIANLNELTHDANLKGNFYEPAGASAIDYANQLLALDPSNDYARAVRDYCVQRGKVRVDGALKRKDFDDAERIVSILAKLLPADENVQNLQKKVIIAREEATVRPAPPPKVLMSRQVTRMVGNKKYPGTLSVVNHHLKFTANHAEDGEQADLDVACEDIKEIKKQGILHKSKFRVSTSSGGLYDFDSNVTKSEEVESNCKK